MAAINTLKLWRLSFRSLTMSSHCHGQAKKQGELIETIVRRSHLEPLDCAASLATFISQQYTFQTLAIKYRKVTKDGEWLRAQTAVI